MPCIAKLQIAKAGEHRTVARIACGHDAVKHVNALRHTLYQIFGCAHAHEVARLVGGQTMWRMRHDLQHLFFRFAHTHATNGITRKIHIDQLIERFLTQVFKHAALNNAKQSIGILEARKFVLAACGPAQTHLHRFASFCFCGEVAFGFVRRALIELHHNVRVQDGLNLHAHLGRHEKLVAVDGR